MSNGLLWTQTSIRPDLQSQLVIIGDLAHPGIGDVIVHLLDRGEDGIYRNGPDRLVFFLISLRRDITPAHLHHHLHGKFTVPGKRRNVMFGVKDFNGFAGDDVRGLQHLRPFRLDPDRLRTLGVELQPHLFEIQDDFCYIFFNSGDRRKFVQHLVDSKGRNRRPLQGRKEDAAKGVPNRDSKASFKRFSSKPSSASAARK
jgi:hypothetical protein